VAAKRFAPQAPFGSPTVLLVVATEVFYVHVVLGTSKFIQKFWGGFDAYWRF
jgi:hypothetical protein